MREFRDPVHGFIRLEDHEAKLVESEPFQRLRRIRQLGLTSYVYHGVEHSRFGHSLGCMHLASQAFDRVVENHRADLAWGEEETHAKRRLLRMAALLHDVGHAPFSHAGEKALFTQPGKHDYYSVALVKSSPLVDIIEDCSPMTGVHSADVADLLSKSALIPHQFLRELISGELGADRMDYLARDSLFCGVKYGVFDTPRLIDCLILKEEEGGGFVLALDEGGRTPQRGYCWRDIPCSRRCTSTTSGGRMICT
jgi:HD superfamily phosphohydrolase